MQRKRKEPRRGPSREEIPAQTAGLRRERAALREAGDQFALFAEQTPNMVFVRELERGGLAYVNARFAEALGYSREELTAPGFDFFVLIAADSADTVRRSRRLHRRGEEHLPFEFAMLARDGRRLDVLLNSCLITYRGRPAVLGIITDITDLHRMGEELRAAAAEAQSERARAESVIAALGESIVVQDRSWRITYQNDVNRRLFGDRVGELCYRVYEGLDRVCDHCPVEETFRDGGVHRKLRKNVGTGAGVRHFELISSPLIDSAGRVVAGLKLIRDITELVDSADALRRATQDLERQNVELRALDRLKDGLIRDVSHELKTPVAKQAMQLEVLRGLLGPEPAEGVARTLAVMEESVRRQQRVIHNLLDLARLESGRRVFRLEPVRLDELLERVLEEHRGALQAGAVTVRVRLAPLRVVADAEMLWHVFSNLASNAVKFARPDGERTLEVTTSAEGGEVAVRFADNGIGLDPADLRRVFDRFFQASAAIEGSGLGLSLCRAMVEGMGGRITLESAGRGRGAVATVTLPLAPEPPAG